MRAQQHVIKILHVLNNREWVLRLGMAKLPAGWS